MSRQELRATLDQLAERYSLRWIEPLQRYVGIHRGVFVEAIGGADEITLIFRSPAADIGDEILEEFAGFEHWRQTGLPSSWIRGLMKKDARGEEDVSNDS